MSRKTDVESLRRQLAQAEANLQLIRERKAQYVIEVDVPLHLIKEERRLLTLVAELKELLKEKAEKILEEVRVLFQGDSLDEAIKLLRSVRSDHPDAKDVERLYLEAVYRKGVRLYEDNKLYQARRTFQEVLAMDSHYKDAARLLRKVEQQLERVPLAIRLPGQALEALRDPVWQGIGAIVAIIALLLTVGPIVYKQVMVSETLPQVATVVPKSIGEVLVKVDTAIDTGGGRCREIVGKSLNRIEVIILDSEGTILQPEIFSYRWHFNPPDQYNQEKLEEDFKGNYYASPGLDNQTVTVEVLREKKMVAARSICFSITKSP